MKILSVLRSFALKQGLYILKYFKRKCTSRNICVVRYNLVNENNLVHNLFYLQPLQVSDRNMQKYLNKIEEIH
jgi:hypothetical protein